MNFLKYLALQCIIFSVILLTSFYSKGYIGKPFTFTDFIAIILVISFIIILFKVHDKLEERLAPISVLAYISILVLAILIASMFTGFLTGEWQISWNTYIKECPIPQTYI